MANNKDIFSFRSRFPEFASTPDADIASTLDVSAQWLDPNVWNPADYPLALVYWAAHFLTLKLMQLASVQFGGTGETDIFIRGISFGERHVQFQQRHYPGSGKSEMVGPGEDLLNQTLYGQCYLMLRQRLIVPVLIV